MASSAQKKATRKHRQRRKAKGIVRLELQVPTDDTELLRRVATLLRDGSQSARMRARQRLLDAVGSDESDADAKELLASMPIELPLERPVAQPREIDL